MFSAYFVVNDDLGEPEKIIPDYEENGRYTASMHSNLIQTESLSR